MSTETMDAIREALKAHIIESAGAENPIVVDYVVGAAYIRPEDTGSGCWYLVHGSDSHAHSLEGLANHVKREFAFETSPNDD